MQLAREIVAIYHGEDQVAGGRAGLPQVFQEQGVPEGMESYRLSPGQTVLDVLVASGLAEFAQRRRAGWSSRRPSG